LNCILKYSNIVHNCTLRVRAVICLLDLEAENLDLRVGDLDSNFEDLTTGVIKGENRNRWYACSAPV